MKTKKVTKNIDQNFQEENSRVIQSKKRIKEKVKYRHQNHWLEEEDEDYVMPSYKDEEEE